MSGADILTLEKSASHVTACFRVLIDHLTLCDTCSSSVISPGGTLAPNVKACEQGRSFIEEWRNAASSFWDARLRLRVQPPQPEVLHGVR